VSVFKDLRKELRKYLHKDQIAEVEQAFLFAEQKHIEQKRRSGEPYITHPNAVAKILAQMQLDSKTIMAALLHDVLEDTEASVQEIQSHFGDEVLELVDGVTKLTRMDFSSKAEAQAESFRKMMLAMTKDIRVILIKIADRLHNMRTIEHMPLEKRRLIAKETLDIYAPIANRLGMHSFMVELEELGFQALYPDRYKILAREVKRARGNRKDIIGAVEKSLKNGFKKAPFKYRSLFGREKHLYSIYRKMRDKHLRFSEVMDIYAFRLLTNDVDSCYRSLGVVHGLYKPVPERFKDFIAIPKANGYQSLHTVLFGPYGVPLEIQIRTVEMEQIAESGIASHWLYKTKVKGVTNAQLQAQEWIKNVLQIQHSTASSLEFIENVKIDLFPEEIYVFTPKGKIIKLPKGATPVDFAYAVHTEVGNNCTIAKIDRRLVPLSTVLQNGQTIEVITVPGGQPDPGWLDFIVTGKARSSIRHFLKGREHAELVKLGRHLLAKSLERGQINIDDLSNKKYLPVLKQLQVQSVDDLFEQIGLGNQLPQLVAYQLEGGDKAMDMGRHRITNEQAGSLAITGAQGMALSFAKCCYPIPGDAVEGILSSGRGIMVHRQTCSNLKALRAHPEKCIHLRWAESNKDEYSVGLLVGLLNRRGALAKVTSAIAQAHSDIVDIRVGKQEDNRSTDVLVISVHDRQHLEKVMDRLKRIDDVSSVSRYQE
jgi:guanosine-3',5'-bis(diphosphate) 3'-pyrophosphohydrolase